MRASVRSSGLSKSAALAGGSLLGNAIAFAATAALTRLYSPAEMGLFAVVSAVALVLTPVVSGRFEAALVIPQSDREALQVMRLGLYWSTAITTLLFVTGVGINRLLLESGVESWTSYLWAAPILAGLMAYLGLFNQMNVRLAQFRPVAIRNVVHPSSIAAAQVLLGAVRSGTLGLISGAIAGRILTLIVYLPGILRLRGRLQGPVVEMSLGGLLGRFSKFPSMMSLSAVINVGGLQAPILVLAHLYGEAAAGQFSLNQRTLGVAIVLVGAAVGQVFLSQVSRAMRDQTGQASLIVWRATAILFSAGSIVSITMFLWGPTMFSIFFGEEWRTAGEIARAMSVSFVFQIVAAPLSQTLVVYERYWTQLAWDFARLLVVVVTLVVAYSCGLGIVRACWALSVASAVMYSLSWGLTLRTVSRKGA